MHYARRQLLLSSLGLAGTALLAACGNAATSPTVAPTTSTAPATAMPAVSKPAAATAAPVATSQPAAVPPTAPAASSRQKITFWSAFGGALGKAMEGIATRYNGQGSDTTVDLQYQGNYEDTAQKLTAALAAKQAPEAAVLGSYVWPRFYLNGSLEPLDELMRAAKVDPADYIESLMSEGILDGQTWMLPFARSTPLFYYNADMFKAAGLPDHGPRNWDEFVEWAPKLVKREGSTLTTSAMAFLTGRWNMAWVYMAMVWQWGGRLSTDITDPDFKIMLGDPITVEVGQFLADLIHRSAIATVPKDTRVDLANGLTATTISSAAELGGLMAQSQGKFELRTAMLPEKQQFGCPTGGPGLAIMTAAPVEQKRAAMDFLAFATSPDQQTIYARETGYVPVRQSALQSQSMKTYYDQNPNAKVAVDQLPRARPQDAARIFIPGGDGIIGKGLDRIMLNNEPPATVLKATADELSQAARPVLAAVKTRRR